MSDNKEVELNAPPNYSVELPSEPVETTPPWPEVDGVSADTPVYLNHGGDWYTDLKPVVETLISAVLMVPALPLIGLAWAAMRLTSRGPGFYIQTRNGKNGKPYRIIKIRSMRDCSTVASNIAWAKLKGDERITRVGKILRALHLDELPQLFNVLRGEMSLVGPRPERPEVIEKKQLPAHVPGYDLRESVMPGVTGLAQVQLPADTDLIGLRHKVCYDLYYLANRTAWLDVRICLATVLKAVLGPETLRKLLALPTREEVCEQFLELLTPPVSDEEPATTPVSAA